jgi:threonine dehydratase
VIPLEEILQARERIADVIVRTPLIRLEVESDAEIWLKLETLQPVNAFKLRGAANAMLQATDAELAEGVLTPSAGNMAQGVAYIARAKGVPATIVVPEQTPQTKLDAIARLGGRVIKVPFDEWWDVLVSGRYDKAGGLFIHPADDARVMAGNGTIGLELLEQSPDFDAVVVPYGGGGLAAGVGSALKASERDVKIYSAEPDTGAPAAASLSAGAPVEVEYTPSFVDASGGRSVLPNVWKHAQEVLDDSFAIPIPEVEEAVRTIAVRARVIAEGAGALSVAAALSSRVTGARKIVCVVSGGNIDVTVLTRILRGEPT